MNEINKDGSTMSWNSLGSEWFELAQTAESRMLFIMPYTLTKLGDVEGKKILDLGCGEGGYSRELAQKKVDCLLNILYEIVTIYLIYLIIHLISYFVL